MGLPNTGSSRRGHLPCDFQLWKSRVPSEFALTNRWVPPVQLREDSGGRSSLLPRPSRSHPPEKQDSRSQAGVQPSWPERAGPISGNTLLPVPAPPPAPVTRRPPSIQAWEPRGRTIPGQGWPRQWHHSRSYSPFSAPAFPSRGVSPLSVPLPSAAGRGGLRRRAGTHTTRQRGTTGPGGGGGGGRAKAAREGGPRQATAWNSVQPTICCLSCPLWYSAPGESRTEKAELKGRWWWWGVEGGGGRAFLQITGRG